MAKNRYIITERAPQNSARVFGVQVRGADEHTVIDVWWDNGGGNCTHCSGPLSAMSGSCKHVAAVKRFLKVKPQPKAVVPTCAPKTVEALRKRAALMRKNAAEYLARAEHYEAEAVRLERQRDG